MYKNILNLILETKTNIMLHGFINDIGTIFSKLVNGKRDHLIQILTFSSTAREFRIKKNTA